MTTIAPLPKKCPRCDSSDTHWFPNVEVMTCLDCGLDWWWSPDDEMIVTNEDE